MRRRAALSVGICLSLMLLGVTPARAAAVRRAPWTHLVVIYEENHSFDNIWGGWPGVNGLNSPSARHSTQVDASILRKALPCLLQDDVNLTTPPLAKVCSGTKADGSSFDSHFPNKPFAINDYLPPTAKTCYVPTQATPSGPSNGVVAGAPGAIEGGCTRDLVHRYYQEQYQLDGGRQDRYVTASDSDGLPMGYYDTASLPLYQYLHGPGAPPYVIDDNFFQGAFGGSFLNHQFLIAAGAPLWPGGADRSGVQTGCATGTANCDLHSVVDLNGMPAKSDLYKPLGNAAIAAPLVADNQLTQAAATPTGALCAVPTGAVKPPVHTTCGDYAVNTIQPFSQPYSPGTAVGKRLPPLTTPNIGDRMSARHLTWAWYAGGWADAAGYVDGPGWTMGHGPDSCGANSFSAAKFPYCPDFRFQFHHQPFNYYDKYKAMPDASGKETNPQRLAHLLDEQDFLAAAKVGLANVSFVKPLGPENEHPGYTGVSQGDRHLVELIKAIQASPDWKSTVIVVTYDEFGGSWDPVKPPNTDRWGPGTRIPAMVISPLLAKPAAVDHTRFDTTSILAMIERHWKLSPLTRRDAKVADPSSAFGARLKAIPTK
ncbi:MAG TPA: alkaline phosphatase family protein [Acidimicrobiia bacterium]